MDTEFAKWLATLGVGGTLAAFMFVFYRKDVRAFTSLWEGQSEQLVQVVKENTAAITSLQAEIRGARPNGRRWSDLNERHGHDR